MEKVDTATWAFLLHVTDWRIMKGIPTPNPLSPTLTANQVTNMRNFIKLDSRMYMSAEWNVAETIVSEVVL